MGWVVPTSIGIYGNSAQPGWKSYDGKESAVFWTYLFQTFSTETNQEYLLTYANSEVPPGPGHTIFYANIYSSDGALIASIPSGSDNDNSWTPVQLVFTAVTPNSTLAFVNGPSGIEPAIDAVSVVPYRTNGPPEIVLSPQTQYVAAKTPVSFAALANGGPATVTWLLDGEPIPDQSTNYLSITASDAGAGIYMAVFSNAFGVATSAPALLTVIGPPTVVTSPANVVASLGDQVTLTAAAVGVSPAIQWWMTCPAGTNIIIGATNDVFTFTASSLGLAGNYFAVFSDGGGVSTSQVAHLTLQGQQGFTNGSFEITDGVNIRSNSYVFLQPSETWLPGWEVGTTSNRFAVVNGKYENVTPTNGSQWFAFLLAYPPWGSLAQTFSTVAGTPCALAFYVTGVQSQYSSIIAKVVQSDGSIIASNIYTAYNDKWTQYGLYFVPTETKVTLVFNQPERESIGQAGIDDVQVFTNAKALLVSPLSQTNAAGTTATFNVSVGDLPSGIQWYFNSGAISHATNLSYSVVATDHTAGRYYAILTNVFGAMTSSPASLVVIDPPEFTIVPDGATVPAGTPIVFRTIFSGSPSAVQWFFNGAPILGAISNTLSFTAALPKAGDYAVTVSNLAGEIQAKVGLTVNPAPFANGGFEATAPTPSPGSYALSPGATWLINWSSGGPSNAVTLINGSTNGAAPYDGRQFILFHANGSPTGGTLSQTFLTIPGEVYVGGLFIRNTGGPSAAAGNESLGVTVTGPSNQIVSSNFFSSPPGYWTRCQFYFVAGGTNATLTFTDTSAETQGIELALDDVSVEGFPTNGAPAVVLSPQSQRIMAGLTATLSAAAVGNTPMTVQWFRDGAPVSAGTNAALSILASEATAGIYDAVFTGPFGHATSAPATLSVFDNLITNGGFELIDTNPIAPNTMAEIRSGDSWLRGWSILGPSNSAAVANGLVDGFNPCDGSQFVLLGGTNGNGATFSQSFRTTPGLVYLVSVEVAEPLGENSGLTATLTGPAGVMLASNEFLPLSSNWTQFQLDFRATTTNATLSLMDSSTRGSNFDLALDAVIVQLVESTNSPIFNPVADQFVNVGQELVTPLAVESGYEPVFFALGSDSPAEAAITLEGVFSWTPECNQGTSTNLITVWAIDAQDPPASNSISFSVVVGDCVQLALGNAIGQAGQSACVPLSLFSSRTLTNLSFAVTAAPGVLTDWEFSGANGVTLASPVQQLGPGEAQFSLAAPITFPLRSSSAVGSVCPGILQGPSTFVPLTLSNLTFTAANGSTVTNVFLQNGRLAVVGSVPMLEAEILAGQPQVTLYSRSNIEYEIETTTNLADPESWNPIIDLIPNGLSWTIPLDSMTNPAQFYRAIQKP